MSKERYLSPTIELLLIGDDVITESNTYVSGDDVGKDPFWESN